MSATDRAPNEQTRGDRRRGEAFNLGGNARPISLTGTQRDVLNALIDRIVPGGDGFPAPSAVGVVEEFFVRYVDADEVTVPHFPYAREASFKAKLDAVGDSVLSADDPGRVEILSRLEREDPEFFGQLRALTYAGYYSRPEVVRAIRANVNGGGDYRGRPQPYGYAEVTEDWDVAELAGGPGSYIPTDDVHRLS
jgi:Gluconate 2-dehydrogenase subunit 3